MFKTRNGKANVGDAVIVAAYGETQSRAMGARLDSIQGATATVRFADGTTLAGLSWLDLKVA